MTLDYEKDIAILWNDLLQSKIRFSQVIERIRNVAQISTVSLNTTATCNLNCKHCFYGFQKPISRLLTNIEWQALIDEFIDIGVRHFHISGREPLTHSTTFHILNYLKLLSSKTEINYGIITNGTLVHKYIELLKNANLSYLDFSIDGDFAENDFLRGSGTFKRVCENLLLSLENNLAQKIYVSSVAHIANLTGIHNMLIKLAEDFSLENFFIQPIIIVGRAKSLSHLFLHTSNYLTLLHSITELMNKRWLTQTVKVEMLIPQSYLPGMFKESELVRRSFEKYLQSNNTELDIEKSKISFRFHLTCLAFWRTVQITPDGYYLGCCMPLASPDYYKYSVGNVLNHSIKDLYHQSITANQLLSVVFNEDNVAECKKMACFNRCYGGCRIITHILKGSWSGRFPLCGYL